MSDSFSVSRHFGECHSRALELMDRYVGFLARIREGLERVQGEAEAAATRLAQAYLLRLDADSLSEAERRTGARTFTRTDPIAAMAQRKHVLEATVARIEADERYIKRQLLVGGHGVLVLELEERRSMAQPWEEDARRFESLDGFLHLVGIGYDTPEFNEHWWQPKYWKHWGQGDAICSELEMDDFGDDVLPAYVPIREKRDEWRRQVGDTEARIKAVHDLVHRHDTSVAAIPRLPEVFLAQCHARLAAYLVQADLQLLASWNAGDEHPDRGVTMALRVLAGLQAKESYLSELMGRGIEPFIDDLRNRAHKYARKAEKYSRGKYIGATWPESVMDRRFLREKAPKYAERTGKLERLLKRILDYDDYARFDLNNDPSLWWFEFTGKRPPSLTPNLRGWYDRHPDLRPLHDEDFLAEANPTAQAVAQVTAARDPFHEQDYLS